METKPTTTPTPSPTQTPKQRFATNPQAVSQHKDMVASPAFVKSADAAMLEFVKNIIAQSDGSQIAALAGFYRIQGAHEFLSQMNTLTVQLELPKPTIIKSLNHDA